MKKYISFVMAMCLLICGVSLESSAASLESNLFTYGDTEITVEGADLSYEQMQKIADHIAGAENGSEVSTYGILCIFGHKLTTSTVIKITHNAYTTTPKCIKYLYDVQSCTRSSCDYVDETLISSHRTATCHG